ncbi:MAG: hypothetical protein ACKERG_04195 [Candidatus Hodgkinia cicadicola]
MHPGSNPGTSSGRRRTKSGKWEERELVGWDGCGSDVGRRGWQDEVGN